MKKQIKTMTTVIAGLALTLGLALTSCKKGDTGPAGPAGSNGTNGVANIQTSTVTTNNSTWGFDNTDNSYNATLNYPAITQAVVDRGTVQVFISDGAGSEWLALPFSYGNIQYLYSYKLGQVLITYTLADNAVPSNPGGQQFKVVVIPPASKSSDPNSNNSDIQYSEQIFKIEG